MSHDHRGGDLADDKVNQPGGDLGERYRHDGQRRRPVEQAPDR